MSQLFAEIHVTLFGYLPTPFLLGRYRIVNTAFRNIVNHFIDSMKTIPRTADVSDGCHVAVLRAFCSIPGQTVTLAPGIYDIEADDWNYAHRREPPCAGYPKADEDFAVVGLAGGLTLIGHDDAIFDTNEEWSEHRGKTTLDVYGGHVRMENVTMREKTRFQIRQGSVTAIGCAFSQVLIFSGQVKMEHCRITCKRGSGINLYADDCDLTLTNCIVEECGDCGIHVDNHAVATLVHCKIRGNKKAGLSTSNNGSVEIIGGSCSDALTEKNGNIIANGCECLGNWLNVDGTGDIKYM